MKYAITFFTGLFAGVLLMGAGYLVAAQESGAGGTTVRLLCGGDVGCLYTPQTNEQVNDLLPVVVPENDLLPVGEPRENGDLGLEWRMVCIEGSGCLYTPYTDDQLDDLLPVDVDRYVAVDIVPEGTWTVDYEGIFTCPGLTLDIPYEPTTATFEPQADGTVVASGFNPDGAEMTAPFYKIGPGSYIMNFNVSADGGNVDYTSQFAMTSETTFNGSLLGTISQDGQMCTISTTMVGTKNG